VVQSQVIGTVGSTGAATGPHLHYEFLLNGVHRNPRTVDLPPANPLPADLMDQFQSYSEGLIAQLQAMDASSPIRIAQRDTDNCLESSC